MNIEILHMIEGAKSAKGITVIIDVFRAFSMEAYAMFNNAKMIIPVIDAEVAYKLKKEHDEYILMGEKHGAIIEGFDYGNSPTSIEYVDFTNKTLVHTTSAGTKGMVNAINASEILTGSLVNAKAIVKYILNSGYSDVSLVCMGLRAEEQTEEDNLCANYIRNLLLGNELDIENDILDLKNTSGSKFFNPDKDDVFPTRDFYLCTDLNKFDFVLRLVKSKDGYNYIEKIDIK